MRLPGNVHSGKQGLLLSVAVLLSVSAALAVGILLFGEFGETEGRVLATTGLLAGYGLLALPAAMLLDRRRLPGSRSSSWRSRWRVPCSPSPRSGASVPPTRTGRRSAR